MSGNGVLIINHSQLQKTVLVLFTIDALMQQDPIYFKFDVFFYGPAE